MKTLNTLIFITILIAFIILPKINNAQVNGINYQAVAVDENGKEIAGMDIQGNVIPDKAINVRFSILSSSASGAVLYQETHTTNTDSHGMFSLIIGQGSFTNAGLYNNILNIDWSTTDQWLKVEIDFKGTNEYKLMGAQKLLSVPFAYYALNVKNVAGDNDRDSTNEIQTLSKSGDSIILSKNGGSVVIPSSHILTSISSGTNRTINISGGTGTTFSIADNDNDSTNELQTLSKVGNTITLSKNGGSIIDSDNQNLSITSNGTQRTINITGGTGVTFDIADSDNDSTNELQTLSYSNDTLRLSKGNFVVISNTSLLPQGSCINSLNIISPTGYTYSGNFYESWDQPWSLYKTIVDTFSYPTQSYCFINVNDTIYMVGGYAPGTLSSERSKRVFAYDIASETWSEKTQLNHNIAYDVILNCNSKIYVASANGNIVNFEEYNISTNTWIDKASVPSEVSGARKFISVNNNIYCFGMQPGSNPLLLIVFKYDPLLNTWEQLQTYDPWIQFYSLTSSSNKIYLVGGSYNGGSSSNSILEFNIINNTFTSFTSPSLINPGLLIKDSLIYVTYNNSGITFTSYNINSHIWNNQFNLQTCNSGQLFSYKNDIFNFYGNCCSSYNPYFNMGKSIQKLSINPQPSFYFQYNNYFYAIQTISSDGQKPNIYKYKPVDTFYIHCKN